MTSFEPHKVRKVAAAFGAVVHGVAGIASVALVVLGWFTVGSGLLASALFLSLAALHIWGVAQFGTLRLSSTGLELDRWHPAVFTWAEVRLLGEDRRRLVLQRPLQSGDHRCSGGGGLSQPSLSMGFQR